jgi:S1-C subfamily serine protease
MTESLNHETTADMARRRLRTHLKRCLLALTVVVCGVAVLVWLETTGRTPEVITPLLAKFLTSQPTRHEAASSLREVSHLRLGGETVEDYLSRRTRWLAMTRRGALSGGEDWNENPDGVVAWASAACVSPHGHFLTAAHSLGSDRDVYILFHCPEKGACARRVRIVWRDDRADLALIHAPGLGTEHFTLAEKVELRLGERVLAAGLELIMTSDKDGKTSMRFCAGKIQTKSITSNAGLLTFESDLPIVQGMSGGPVVLTDGRLVGVNTAVAGRPRGFLQWLADRWSARATGVAIEAAKLTRMIATDLTQPVSVSPSREAAAPLQE